MSAGSRGSQPITKAGMLVVACLLLASGAAGFLAHHLFNPARATLYPDPAGARPLRPPGGGNDSRRPVTARAIPEELPDIALPGLDGTPQRLAQWKGRPLLVNFWATWCEPCRREIPLLQSLRRERASDGLEIVGIAVDMRDATRKYALSQGIDYPVLVGQEGGLEAVNAFGMDTVLPFSVFVDAKGRILTLKVGELHRDEAELILDRLARVSSGKLSFAEARSELPAALKTLAERRIADSAR